MDADCCGVALGKHLARRHVRGVASPDGHLFKRPAVACREETSTTSRSGRAREDQPAAIGRPSKFKPEYVEQARKLTQLGATDREVAEFFEVSERH